MARQSTITCDVCKKDDSEHKFYWYHLSSGGYLDWDEIAVDLCSIACLKEWAEKKHCRAHPKRLGRVMTAI